LTDYLTGLGGYTLYKLPIDVKQSPKSQLIPSRQFLGEPGTRRDVVTHTTNLPLKYSIGFSHLERAEFYAMLEFFHAVRGRRAPFWWIFEQNLFTPSANYVTGQSVIGVEENLSVLDYRGHERVFILLDSGDLLTFQVTAIAPGLNPGDPYSMTLGEVLDRDILMTEIEMFGKLLFCRMDTDELKMPFSTSETATANLDFMELVEEYPA
jgi:hypothetical protein